MPKLSEFSLYTETFVDKVAAAGSRTVGIAIEFGKDYMREYIAGDSPTGHPWHEQKNAANGYPAGSRMGNAVAGPDGNWTVQDNPGHMFRMVQSLGPATSGDKTKIVGLFGWIDAENDPSNKYFIEQDSGNYHTGKHIGMGLLNKRMGDSRGVLQNLGAMVATGDVLAKEAAINGFKVSGKVD